MIAVDRGLDVSRLQKLQWVARRSFGKRRPPVDLNETASALRAAAVANLAAVLEGAPLRPLPPAVSRRSSLLRRKMHQGLPGGLLAGLPAGLRPTDVEIGLSAAIDLITDPAAVQVGQTVGAAAVLPLALRAAFSDGRLLQALAVTSRDFLSSHVVFHPDPAPFPRFSPHALAVLCLSLASHRKTLPAAFAAWIDAAVLALWAETDRRAFWDQWLFVRMARAPGWGLPQHVEAVPLVLWDAAQASAPGGTAASGFIAPEGWPANWRSLTALTV